MWVGVSWAVFAPIFEVLMRYKPPALGGHVRKNCLIPQICCMARYLLRIQSR